MVGSTRSLIAGLVVWPRRDFLEFIFEICGGGEKGKVSKKFAGAREDCCKARIWDAKTCLDPATSDTVDG